ncbi:PVC-type heme-binding CxxCH protein [Paracnuella aquatica]|uniref:PVC-type heme-binding CxxCH protein n=1 Tax=Paracnuella aquatica TaxID=2268757 RepID=UPI000DEF96F6|nr:PVC-type heme-binding CxxCH protein [Paracnuella aquatica]RPD51324.1 dehydrogenase [Paracnuella aquatica]
MTLKPMMIPVLLGLMALSFTIAKQLPDDPKPRRLELLLLGHKSQHHNSDQLANIFVKEYFKDGFNISYTTDPNDLNDEVLSHYDGLILYANHDSITAPQEKALLNFVRSGKGFIPIHSASWCFRNSPEVVDLIGGQFKRHKYDSFPAVIVRPDHQVVKGVPTFTTLDETYVHDKLSKDITVLTERVEGDHREPYTWVKEYGKGRVFYTAYGHDEHTFNNKGFLQLVKNGILYAVGQDAVARLQAYKIADPKYFDGPVPNYERRDPAPKVQQSLSPQESMSLMQVPVGFELQLFASEPDVVNPIFMNWDEKGRLWVIETVDYPNEVKDDDVGDDRIKILEDTNGDGKADKFTIFAEKLNIPTSFTFVNGGIILSQAPDFLFLKDTDGDGKADVRQTILSGWGKSDTHAQASNLRYGMDNKIWGVVGYSGYYNGKKGKDSLRFGNGVYRFDVDGKNLEFLSNTSNNTWGLGFSEENDVFISTANNTHSAFFGMPKRYFDKAKINESGVEKIDAHYGMRVATKNLRQVDVHGGFTSAAGHSLYTARTYPKEYWNRVAFVTEPTGRLVHRTVLKRNGSGFTEDGDGWNMLTSADEWAGPIQAEVGPDGAVWVTDWYDFIIQHNPTPSADRGGYNAQNGKGNAYINPLRDHERGRIYRIAYKGNDQKNTMKLDKGDKQGLLAALSNDNMFWRNHAQRLLVENRDASVLPALYKLVQNEQLDGAGINAPAVHALWTIHGLKALNGTNVAATNVAIKALSHPAGGVRKAAIEVLPKTPATFAAMNKAGVFTDKDLRVRLAAVLATTDMKPSAEIGTVLVDMAEREENVKDTWLKHALTIAGKLNEETFKAAFRKRGLNMNPSLVEASVAQRLAFGSRLSDMQLRRSFGRQQQADAPAPELAGKEFLISGDVERAASGQGAAQNAVANGPIPFSGMLAAQGDATNGYGVYFLDNKMYFQINQGGKTYKVATAQAVPNKFSFKAGLQKDGTMRLIVDNKDAGTAKAAGVFAKDLEQPLRVGVDRSIGQDRIFEYPDSMFFLRANLTNAKLEMLSPVASATAKATEKAKVDKVIVMKVVKDVMKFDKELITAQAGTTVQLVLENPDFMQHNLVLIKPKTLEKVGAAADKLASDPNGAKMQYVPKMPEVLYATPLVNPGGKFTLTMKIPDQPGDYPYVCTFPGHWRIMKGVLRVTK